MFIQTLQPYFYSFIIISLFFIDYFLGNGFVEMCQRTICKLVCFLKRSLRDEAKIIFVDENPVNVPILITEFIILCLTILFLNKYKSTRCHDRLDKLLQESKDGLKQTNEFLEKWRLRRIQYDSPTGYTYLDEEPQDIKPYKLEVPILHMAIVDTLGRSRSQPERGDAGDRINITDSTLLSLTSLMDEDFDSIAASVDDRSEEPRHVELKDRCLWNVIEEDSQFFNDES